MPEPDFNLIMRQYERLLLEIRGIRDKLAILPSMREELAIMRDQLRVVHIAVSRLEDAMTFNVLDRIQKLEQRLDQNGE